MIKIKKISLRDLKNTKKEISYKDYMLIFFYGAASAGVLMTLAAILAIVNI